MKSKINKHEHEGTHIIMAAQMWYFGPFVIKLKLDVLFVKFMATTKILFLSPKQKRTKE